ncbi:MAG: hypothetical protein GWP08_01250 [Nitrospiraceae bacterium]|nr:hypothetical protein [Nitrospiraceae bacterium]
MVDEQPTPDAGAAGAGRVAPIAWAFHLRLIAKIGLLLVLGTMTPAALFWLATDRTVAQNYLEAFIQFDTLRIVLLRTTVVSAAAQVVLVGGLIAGLAVLASHKIAGPLVRLDHNLRKLAEGSLNQTLRFRRGDQDRSLPAAFEALRVRLRDRVRTAEMALAELQAIQRGLADLKPGALSASELERTRERMREEAARLRAAGTVRSEGHER